MFPNPRRLVSVTVHLFNSNFFFQSHATQTFPIFYLALPNPDSIVCFPFIDNLVLNFAGRVLMSQRGLLMHWIWQLPIRTMRVGNIQQSPFVGGVQTERASHGGHHRKEMRRSISIWKLWRMALSFCFYIRCAIILCWLKICIQCCVGLFQKLLFNKNCWVFLNVLGDFC